MSDIPSGSPGANHRPAAPPITLVTVPGLHGSDDTHWQTWLEEQVKRAVRVRQRGRDAAQLGAWSEAVRHALAEISGAVVLASHGFGCLATAHALSHLPHGAFYLPGATVLGVLMVAPGSPEGSARPAHSMHGGSTFLRSSSAAPPIPGCRSRKHAVWRSAGTAHSSISAMRDISMHRQDSARGRWPGMQSKRSRVRSRPTIAGCRSPRLPRSDEKHRIAGCAGAPVQGRAGRAGAAHRP